MFIQAISGKVVDSAELRRQWVLWHEELRPSAPGYLGSTAGIAADGRFVAVVRFASGADAAANSSRREQGEWWSATERCLDGSATFADSEDVTFLLGGGSDEAGFVQILRGTETDRGELEEFDTLFEKHARVWRPEFLGGTRAWTGSDSYIEAVYFTSEAAARSGESSEPPAELAARMGDFEAIMSSVVFTNLMTPWIA
jgi:hypothetical protein